MAKQRDADLAVWNGEAWGQRRQAGMKCREMYEGKYLDVTQPGRDREDGGSIPKFPMKLNLASLSCDIHADIARGMPLDDDPLIVRTVIERGKGIDDKRAAELEMLINDDLYRSSAGGPEQWQALLHMQIYGGAVFRLVWEPWDRDLPLGLGVRLLADPNCLLATFDDQNPWRILECYYGFKISPEMARLKYHVEPEGNRDEVLYLEYWSSTEWWVHVDGKVPVMEMGDEQFPLRGANPWGFVPFYYVPMKRSTKTLGDSLIKNQRDLSEEFNARAVGISDLVRDVKGSVITVRDTTKTLELTPLSSEGKLFRWVLDLGTSRSMPGGGARPPTAEPLGIPEVPDSILGWPNTILDFWMLFYRLSPAAFGMDDTKSGRITGPAVAQRMWSTTSAAATARAYFSRVKTMIDRDFLYILSLPGMSKKISLVRSGAIPSISSSELRVQIRQQWPLMLPLDRQELLKGLTELYKEGGISVELLLKEWGREDVAEERERNLAWRADVLKQEQEFAPKQNMMMGGGNA